VDPPQHQLSPDRVALILRNLRVEKGLRQVDVAERLGQPQSFVSKYENGERRLDFVEVAEVCKALDVSLEDFVRRFREDKA
jgi:transcriptional regulator with XRE-family HTH domain